MVNSFDFSGACLSSRPDKVLLYRASKDSRSVGGSQWRSRVASGDLESPVAMYR
jgi:hypothetical protein